MALQPTAYSERRALGEGGQIYVGQLIRFGTGSGPEVPLLVFADRGMTYRDHQKLLESPQEAQLPGDLVREVQRGPFQAVDVLFVHFRTMPSLDLRIVQGFGRFVENAIGAMRKARPGRIAFLGAGQGATLAVCAGISTAESSAVAGLIDGELSELLRVVPKRCRKGLPAVFTPTVRLDHREDVYARLPRGLVCQLYYIGGLQSLASFTMGALAYDDAWERYRAAAGGPRSPLAAVRARLDEVASGEERLPISAGALDVTFELVGEQRARAVALSLPAGELRVRWTVGPRRIGVRLDSDSGQLRLRILCGPSPSLLQASRKGRGSARAPTPHWGLAARPYWKYASSRDARELDAFRLAADPADGVFARTFGTAAVRSERRLTALLLQLSRQARRRCDPAAVQLARRFHPDARWLVYSLLQSPRRERFRDLVERCPGALVLAVATEPYCRVPEVGAALRAFGRDGDVTALTDALLRAHWAAHGAPRPSPDLDAAREVVRSSAPGVLPIALGFAVESCRTGPRPV